ncbi:pentapeptide repeat-containing protein [Methanolobus halotolerans]
MNLENTDFINCRVYNCDFVNNNLKNANFEDSDLKDSIFKNTDLSHASFKNAISYNIDPTDNFLKSTKFSVPEVISLLNVYDIELV